MKDRTITNIMTSSGDDTCVAQKNANDTDFDSDEDHSEQSTSCDSVDFVVISRNNNNKIQKDLSNVKERTAASIAIEFVDLEEEILENYVSNDIENNDVGTIDTSPEHNNHLTISKTYENTTVQNDNNDNSLENEIMNEVFHEPLSVEATPSLGYVLSSPNDLPCRRPEFAALRMNLSFAGCGFLGIYHLGVVHALVQHGPRFLLNVQGFGGASAGSLVAAALAIRGPDLEVIQRCIDFCYDLANTVRHKKLGVLTPRMSLLDPLRHFLDNMLPDDAHIIARDRLFVSVTDIRRRHNHLCSEFQSREELIQHLLASSYVPFFTGTKPVKIGRKMYMDGGMTDNLPEIPGGRTILVSPFSGRQHISPEDATGRGRHVYLAGEYFQLSVNNLIRGYHAFSPPKHELMELYFQRGRHDCIRFLKKEHFYDSTIADNKIPEQHRDMTLDDQRDL